MLLTVGCVAVFWSLVTAFAATLRRLIFALHQPEVPSNAGVRVGESVDLVSDETSTVRSWSLPRHSWRVFRWLHINEVFLLALLDSVAAMEVCACSLECWPIRAAAGNNGLLFAIAMNGVRGAIFTCKDAYGSPCNPWYRLLRRKSDPFWVGITWALQLLSAHVALTLVQIWWSLKLTEHHAASYKLLTVLTSKTNESTQIPSDLRVSPYSGFFVEGIGTFVDFYLAFLFVCVLDILNSGFRITRDCSAVSCSDRSVRQTAQGVQVHPPSKFQFLSAFFLRLCIILFLVAKGLGLTGMYLNPANAYVHTWRVGSIPLRTHLFVYWLGPFCGVWLSVQLEDLTSYLLQRTRQLNRSTVHESSAPSSSVPGNSFSIDRAPSRLKVQSDNRLTTGHRNLNDPSHPG
ncbi:unnamed protein product [Dicrocoelium dendriticum]|nr:unnamed protein product [Dicrocoelium dendriticum]